MTMAAYLHKKLRIPGYSQVRIPRYSRIPGYSQMRELGYSRIPGYSREYPGILETN